MTATATIIPISLQRMVCTGCGAEANASCNCGVAYQPKSVRAREAIEAYPWKSDRTIAAEIGASPTTVGKARQLSADGQLAERVGLDGKIRKVREKAPEPRSEEYEREDIPDLSDSLLIAVLDLLNAIVKKYDLDSDEELKRTLSSADKAFNKLHGLLERRERGIDTPKK